MAEERHLFGTPSAEVMYGDAAECYETEIAPWVEPAEEAAAGQSATIEEWTSHPPSYHMPTVDRLIEQVVEWAADELDEGGYDAYETAGNDPEVVAAFEAALDLMASKVTYRMADTLYATHTVTWDADGEPLLDGEPMYGEATHG